MTETKRLSCSQLIKTVSISTDGIMSTGNLGLTDCYDYFDGNGCVTQSCPYRHHPIAKKNTQLCIDWLAGNCTWYNCPRRHARKKEDISIIEKNGFKVDIKPVLDDLIDLTVSEEDVNQECGLCLGLFTRIEMFCFIACDHSMCHSCAVSHFENQIKSKAIKDITCPYSNCVNLEAKDDVEIHEYFSLLILQLKGILKAEVMELLEKKVRDWSLTSDPDFIWCPGCGNGMIIDDHRNNYVSCMECEIRICSLCKKVWTEQHARLTCEQFKILCDNETSLKDNDDALEKFLASFGVVCPSCKTKFVKSSGGCLHFTCTVCKYKFCEGCLQPFYNKGECPQLNCKGLGFHAHHPRNCFFYLRDWTPERLRRLLIETNIPYDSKPLHAGNKCPIVEQKEKDDQKIVDEQCGDDIKNDYAGLCCKHYTQYLGWLVLKHKVDPILQYSIEELERLLDKSSISLPPRSINYRKKLLDLVRNLKENGELSNTTTISEAYAPLLLEKNKKEKSKPENLYKKCNYEENDENEYDEDEGDDVNWEDYYEDEVTVFSPVASQPLDLGPWVCSNCNFVNNTPAICSRCQELLNSDNSSQGEDKDDEISGAIAPLSRIESFKNVIEKSTWICSFCTLINNDEDKICQICCRTREISIDGYEVTYDGIQCDTCTLINDPNANICVVCGTTLNKVVSIFDLSA